MISSKELIKYTRSLNILFAEDYDGLRENTAEILNSFFKNVFTANDGQEAIEIYTDKYSNDTSYFDIVLSDIQMPKLDGVELTKKIYDMNQDQVVIILSAYDESKYLLNEV